MSERQPAFQESPFTTVTGLRAFLEEKLKESGSRRKFRIKDILTAGYLRERTLVRDTGKREGNFRQRLGIKTVYGGDQAKVELLHIGLAWVPDGKGEVRIVKAYGVGKSPDDLRIFGTIPSSIGNIPGYLPIDYRQVPNGLKEISDWLNQAGLLK